MTIRVDEEQFLARWNGGERVEGIAEAMGMGRAKAVYAVAARLRRRLGRGKVVERKRGGKRREAGG